MVLVTELRKEMKSGARFKKDISENILRGWKKEEEAQLPTLEDADSKYQELKNKYQENLANVEAEHQREIWGYMHALYENDAPIELKQGVYARFLATNPKDNLVRCVAHNNLGNIFYKHKEDYKSAKVHYERAKTAVEQELAQNPANKDAVTKLAEAKQNLELCNEKLAA